MRIPVVLEDPDFVIVEKPAGVSSQPLARHSPTSMTVASLLAGKFPEIKSVGGSDWGAAHRLDRDTSGLIVFARNEVTYRHLRAMFSKNEVEKEYTALVKGVVERACKIQWPIGRDPKTSKRVKVYRNPAEARRNKAQEAVTIVETSRKTKSGTLVTVTIKTGRRHQIRAHLAALGHPVVGDALYGGPEAGRLHLHASRLRFRHPRHRGWVEASSTAPFS